MELDKSARSSICTFFPLPEVEIELIFSPDVQQFPKYGAIFKFSHICA